MATRKSRNGNDKPKRIPNTIHNFDFYDPYFARPFEACSVSSWAEVVSRSDHWVCTRAGQAGPRARFALSGYRLRFAKSFCCVVGLCCMSQASSMTQAFIVDNEFLLCRECLLCRKFLMSGCPKSLL